MIDGSNMNGLLKTKQRMILEAFHKYVKEGQSDQTN